MSATPASMLGSWSNFYTIVGSAAAALTGLMFVVITLVAGRPANTSHDAIGTFSTPTVVNFSAALLIAALMAAPWPSLVYLAVVLGVLGVAGVGYASHVVRRTSRLSNYQAETDDWVWYAIAPFVAYIIIVVSAAGFVVAASTAMFGIAAGTILLVLIGIRNAWDVVTYIAVDLEPNALPPVSEDAEKSAR